MDDLARALDVALEIANAGARIAHGHFGKSPSRERKADGSWVTEADWAAEAQIRLRLSRSFPDHNILGEEEGLTAAGGGPAVDGAPTWVVDPIDGTNNFMMGVPIWATLLALNAEGRNVLGVVVAPALGETYAGAVGLGARLNGSEIHVDPGTDLSEAVFSYSSVQAFHDAGLGALFDAISSRVWRSRGFGDFWGHMLVARGSAQVMLEPALSVWDVAALEPIVTEAGGLLTDLDGNQWFDGAPCLTTNGALHEQVLGLYSGSG